MKNIKQLQVEIKESGLTGSAAEIELYKRLLGEAKGAVAFIVNSPLDANVKPEYLADDLAGVLEIFNHEAGGDFDRSDFAEDLQNFLFTFNPKHRFSYSEWRNELFGDETEMSETVETAETAETESSDETEPDEEDAATDKFVRGEFEKIVPKIIAVLKNEDGSVPPAIASVVGAFAQNYVFEANVGSGDIELLEQSLAIAFEESEYDASYQFARTIETIIGHGNINSKIFKQEEKVSA